MNKSTLLALLISAGLVLNVLSMMPSASALSAISFTDKPTFSSLQSNKWEQVWTNSTSGNTYFLDMDGTTGKVRSVVMNSTGSVLANNDFLAAGEAVTPSTTTASATKTDNLVRVDLASSQQILRTGSTTFVAAFAQNANSLLVGQSVNQFSLWLGKNGSPTGTAIIAVFDSSGNTLYQFGTIDVSTLTTTPTKTTFTNTSAWYTIQSGDRLGAFYNGGSVGNELEVDYITTDRYDGTTNTIRSSATGTQGSASWSSQTTNDLRFELDLVYSPLNTLSDTSTYWENDNFKSRATQSAFSASVNLGDPTATQNIISSEKVTGTSALVGVSVNRLDALLSTTTSPSGTITAGVFSATTPANRVTQSSGTGNVALDNTNKAVAEHINTGAALIGQTVNSMDIALNRVNSPTGTATVCVMDSSANCTYTFGTIDVSTLNTSDVELRFTNISATHTIQDGDYIGVKYTDGDATNFINVIVSGTDVYDTTLAAAAIFTTSWGSDLTRDLGDNGSQGDWELNFAETTLLYTFGTMSASSLTSSPQPYSFVNTVSSHTLATDEYVGIYFQGGKRTHNVMVHEGPAADAYDGTNTHKSVWNIGWTDSTTTDIAFRLINTQSNPQASNTYIKLDNGSNQNIAGVQVHFPDATKIPGQVTIYTSTDDVSYTSRLVASPDQSTGTQNLVFSGGTGIISARYVRMNVTDWGSANEIAASTYLRLKNSLVDGLAISAPELSGSQRVIYYVQADASTSDDFSYGIMDIDTGEILKVGYTLNAGGGSWVSTTDKNTVATTKNKVYYYGAGGTTQSIMYSSNRDLTGFASVGTSSVTGNIATQECKAVTDGATAADDRVFCNVGSASQNRLIVWSNAGEESSQIVGTGAASGSNQFIVPLSDKVVYYRTISGPSVEIYTVTQASPYTISSEVFDKNFLTRPINLFTFNGTIRTYNTAQDLYLQSTDFAASYTGGGVLTDPDVAYIEVVTPETGTLTVLDDANQYKIADDLFVTGSTTTWTPRTIGTVINITPTAYEESVGSSLIEDTTAIVALDVIKLQCGVTYDYLVPRIAVSDDSDCTGWRVLAESAATVGRELTNPYSRTPDLVHADPFTGYAFQLQATNPDQFFLESFYNGTRVDTAQSDLSGQLQQRYLYGQCYDVTITNILTDVEVVAGSICANDFFTKTLRTDDLSINTIIPEGDTWYRNAIRNFSNSTHNDITFLLDNVNRPWNASIYISDHWAPAYRTISVWNNVTNSNGLYQLTIDEDLVGQAIGSEDTIYVSVFDQHGNQVDPYVLAGTTINLGNPFASLGPFAGLPIGLMAIVVIALQWNRSDAYIGIIITMVVTALLLMFGVIPFDFANTSFWGAMFVFLALGVFGAKKYFG